MSELEICEVCEEATGKAGGVEDSLYLENWGGPFCDECYDSQVEELANSYGAVKAMALKYRATIAEQGAEIAELKGMLKVARCPNTTCSDGILCVGPEIAQCQWCYEVSQFINPIGDPDE